MSVTETRRKRRRSERGNWLVVTYVNGKIWWCKWIQTWAGVQASKRHADKDWPPQYRRTVVVLDIERMMDFAVTEGANEISDLYELYGRESNE